MRATALVLATAHALTGSVAWAENEDDVAAIHHQQAEAYVAAYNQQDAAALSGLWAEDAVYRTE